MLCIGLPSNACGDNTHPDDYGHTRLGADLLERQREPVPQVLEAHRVARSEDLLVMCQDRLYQCQLSLIKIVRRLDVLEEELSREHVVLARVRLGRVHAQLVVVVGALVSMAVSHIKDLAGVREALRRITLLAGHHLLHSPIRPEVLLDVLHGRAVDSRKEPAWRVACLGEDGGRCRPAQNAYFPHL